MQGSAEPYLGCETAPSRYLRRPEELGATTMIARETITAWEPWDEEG